MKDSEILENYNNIPYYIDDCVDGTFRKHKLKGKKMELRKGYRLNPYTYELEETKQTWE